jgi:hypothetical protein
MAITLNGTSGINTPNETVVGSLQAGGVTTNIYPVVQGTAVTCAGQTSIDFTSVPSWVKRITVVFNGVSGSGTSNFLVQLGVAGVATTSGYVSASSRFLSATGAQTTSTAGFLVTTTVAAGDTQSGLCQICNVSGNVWVATSVVGSKGASNDGSQNGGGNVTLAGVLDMIRVTTVNGSDTFDTTPSAGSVNILYE